MKTISDAAKRVSDTYALHKIGKGVDAIGKWFAVALNDGRTDNVLYDNKADAVRHQRHNENFYAFVQVTPASMTPADAQTYLDLNRRMYDAGLRLADRDSAHGGRDMIRRLSAEDQKNQIRALFVGDRAPSNIILPGLGEF